MYIHIKGCCLYDLNASNDGHLTILLPSVPHVELYCLLAFLHEKYVFEGLEQTSTPSFDKYIKLGFFNDVIIIPHKTPITLPMAIEVMMNI